MSNIIKARTLYFVLLATIFSTQSMAQSIDLAHYARLDNPPEVAHYIELKPENYVERWDYTHDFSYNDLSVLKIERFAGIGEATESVNINYFTVDEDSFNVAGISLTLEFAGDVIDLNLELDELAEIPRVIEVGQTLEQTGTSRVQLGFFPVNVDVYVSYELQAIETIETPLATFEGCAKVLSTKTMKLTGIEESLVTMEWYHPSVGLVQIEEIADGDTMQIDSITPPFTDIHDWLNLD